MQKAYHFEMPSPEQVEALERRGRQIRNEYIRGLIIRGAKSFARACQRPGTTAKAAIQR